MMVCVSKRAAIARVKRVLHKGNKILVHRHPSSYLVVDLTTNTAEGEFSLSEILNSYDVIKDYEEAIL